MLHVAVCCLLLLPVLYRYLLLTVTARHSYGAASLFSQNAHAKLIHFRAFSDKKGPERSEPLHAFLVVSMTHIHKEVKSQGKNNTLLNEQSSIGARR